MKRIAGTLFALAAGLAWFPGEAGAQAHGESVQDIEARMNLDPQLVYATKMSDLDTWLRRLVGRFRTADGHTRVDCAGIGSGPGVRCVSRYVGPGIGPDTPGPAFALYGVDPDLPGIRTLRVSGLSIADHDEGGKLKGNTVTFQSACPLPVHTPGGETYIRCEHQIRIFAPPDSDSVLFGVRTNLTMILRSTRGIPGRAQAGAQIVTVPHYDYSEWQRLADDEVSEPVLQLQTVALDSLEQYGKAEVPELTGHVVDRAGSLVPEQRADLEAQLATYESQTAQRIIVVTVNALGADSIEAFAQRAVETWRLGSEAHTDYILVAIAPNDGTARIGSGTDMRACVPDATAQRILDEEMIPEFLNMRFGEGIAKGVAQLMAACRDLPAAAEQ